MISLPSALLQALGATPTDSITQLAGNENDNYLVKTLSCSYVVRRIRTHTAASTEAEALYCELLSENGLPVLPFLKLRGDSHVLSSDGDNYIATKYTDGVVPTVLEQNFVEQAGEILARTHSVHPGDLPKRYTWFTESYIRDSTKEMLNEHKAAKTDFLKLDAMKNDFWRADLPQTIVHGDYHRQNIVANEHGTIVRILDWEEACVGPAILDVGYAIRALSFNDGACDKKRFDAFLKGYQRIRRLTATELSLLEAAMQYTTLLLSVWAYLKFSRGQISKELLDDLGSMYKTTYTIPK